MGKEVLVTVCGIQNDGEGEPQPIQVVSTGQRYEKNNKTYLIYEEVISEDSTTQVGEVVKNTVCISDGQLDLIKRGHTGVHLVFVEGQSNQTLYNTPYGSLEVTMNTSELSISMDEERIDVIAKYNLEINHEQVADCVVTIQAK